MNIEIKLLPGATLPKYMTVDAAGLDCYAHHNAVVPAMSRVLVGLGFSIAIPKGYEGHIRPRSGMALKLGVMAAFGTIDADYRGVVGATLFNHTEWAVHVEAGDRVCQLVIAPVVRAFLIETGELDGSERGTGGYGHTGSR